ncbi:rho guanine nucleotide exchange factor 19 [Eucyclogobius newberryi]|uniref:rho guanine nucleotide exchange factor 19 n=1 Tax=Eucyclogobius newberryi TaxID=166745 RepID=UPI003B5B8C70
MLPGYGLSPLPDFQPHLQPFGYRDSPNMWIPGSGDTQTPSEGQEDRQLLRSCHHKHVAVCQQETLAFIELQPSLLPKGSGLSPPRTRNGFKHSVNSLKERRNGHHRTYSEQTVPSHTDTEELLCVSPSELLNHTDTHSEPLCEEEEQPPVPHLSPVPEFSDKPREVTTVCRPLHTALSLPLSLPLSSLYSSSHFWDSPGPSSPETPEAFTLVRRTSQGSLKEKSMRRKMQVYSPESPTDECPLLDPDFLFPGPLASFLEEDLSLSSLETLSPSSYDSGTDLPSLSNDDIFHLPEEPLHIIEDPISDLPEENGVELSIASGGSSVFRRGEERRRFSASELISRLQLSQRKNSFTLKLGKSLSARVSSRDRQSSSLSPNMDLKLSSRQRSSGCSSDSAPHSPVGMALPLSISENGLQRWSTKLGMRKKSIEEDMSALPALSSSNRLSRFLPSSILYQEYSDVAINREIQRQQGKEPGTEEESSDGTPSPSNLSPSNSFRSSRGSAFALWQDIPDVRTSGQLDNFSNEQRKLQEAKFELVSSEASYIRSLTIAVDHFMLSQDLAECLGAQDKQWLFSKLPEVKDVSERFLQDLEQRLEEDILRFDVCDIVLNHCAALRRVYLPYVTNQAYQEQTYQRLLQENPRFPSILSRLEEDPVCQRLPLTSFLILPFQRITRLKMLVENILKRTAPGSRDEDTATKAFNELKKIIKECNSSVQSMKRMEELIHLNKKIHFEGKIFPLISQSRWLVKHGELLEVDTQMMTMSGSKLKLPTKPVYLHLFNDCLLLSRRKDTWKFMVFVHAKIGALKVKDLNLKLQGVSGFIFHLQLCEGQQLKHQILLKAHTESGKQRWITAMFPSDPLEDIEQATDDDISQVQCIKSYQAQEHDELTLEKADILHAKTITSDGWVEGIRLSDGERGWFPKTYIEEITSRSARLRNLRENIRIKCVTQKLEGD